jgi:hypothetical protein
MGLAHPPLCFGALKTVGWWLSRLISTAKLVSNNRDAEAHSFAEKVRKAAHTASEQKMAQGLLDQMRDHRAEQDQGKP